MPEQPLWIGEAEVAELLSLEDAIEVLARSFRLQAGGEASSMPRAHLRRGDSILHAVGGAIDEDDLVGTKTWAYTPRGAAPLLVLFSSSDGHVRGVVEAFRLGQLRTAATSGLATRALARADARTLALLGTGKQARAQAEAVAAVREIREVRLFGRDADRRAELAEQLRERLGADVVELGEVGEALAGADVATAVTRAAAPIVTGEMIEPGLHLNAVGAIVPSRRELAPSAVAAFDAVVVDSLEQARDDAGELRAAADEGLIDWARVGELGAICAEGGAAGRGAAETTLFKALGVGLSDVALGAEIVRRAQSAGVVGSQVQGHAVARHAQRAIGG